jgi:Protein of unknown function (DUF616).
MNGKVVYTVITGGYDALKPPEAQAADGWDFVCFTDGIGLPRGEAETATWKLRPIPWRCQDDPARLSRFPKLNPHLVLPEYDRSLYIDANMRLTDKLLARANEELARGEICAMCRHPDRGCVYREAVELLDLGVGEPKKIFAQTKFLLGRGYPARAGLHQCNIILRAHNDPRVVAFSEAWWGMFSRFSRRDQMAADPALREAALVPAELLTPGEAAELLAKPHTSKPHPFFPLHKFNRLRCKSRALRLRMFLRANGIDAC